MRENVGLGGYPVLRLTLIRKKNLDSRLRGDEQ